MKARDNPFSVERIEKIRYRPLHTTFDSLLLRLEELDYRAAITGPQGAGKTTLLEDIRDHLDRTGRKTAAIFINDMSPLTRPARKRFLASLTGREIVFIDGADSLNTLTWLAFKRAILKRAAGLVITAHQPTSLPSLIECATTVDLFRSIVADLLPEDVRLDSQTIDRAFERHAPNIRIALRQLYDTCAER
ncbi:MAG: hypothetical protein JW720_10525 [Sedimentisphaerales bacterium]|nr:hypothetical protein [Sedimentisphaerales bacterium]